MGNKIWRVDIKHDGRLKIVIGSDRFFRLVDEKNRNCFGNKIWRAGIKHEGRFVIDVGPNSFC